jgi:hypothetical protein
MSKGAEMIVTERLRQITEEGYSKEHDRRHINDELILAAIAYAIYGRHTQVLEKRDMPEGVMFADPWPWPMSFDNRENHDQLRRLVIAAALIAAEIDRLLARGDLNDK